MRIDQQPNTKKSYQSAPFILLVVCLFFTFQQWYNVKATSQAAQEDQFNQLSLDVNNRLQQQMAVYEQALLGVKSFFAASQSVESDEFHRFTRRLIQAKQNKAIESIGYVQLSKVGDEPVAKAVYIEPQNSKTYHELGINHFAFDQQKQAMLDASDNNLATITAKTYVKNADGSAKQQAGFFMYLPTYRNQVPHDTVALRRQHITGWVFAAFSVDALMRNVFPENCSDICVALYDGQTVSANTRIFRQALGADPRQPHHFSHTQVMHVLGHDWTLITTSSAAFEHDAKTRRPWYVALIGIAVSVFLSLLLGLYLSRTRTLQAIDSINNELKSSEQRWKFALEGSGDGIWEWDIPSDQVVYSTSWQSLYGSPNQAVQHNLHEWLNRIHPDDLDKVRQDLDFYLLGKKESFINEHRMRCNNGDWKWVMCRGMVVRADAQGKPSAVIGTHTDITALKASEEASWKNANFDFLTNLPNRRMLYDQLHITIEKAKLNQRLLGLIFLDLDRFKEINDTLGHDKGDKLLKDATRRIQGCIRPTDILSRIGGDEFAVIVNDIEALIIVEKMAHKILNVLAQPFQLEDEYAYITASLGITHFPKDGHTVDALMKNVDQAMYASKNAGRNCLTFFTSSMQVQARKRMALIHDLRLAVAQQQFYLVYQPILNLKTGEIAKAEALIRWPHPELGLVSPDVFIPLAEETGLIVKIGEWVFQEAATQAKKWRNSISPHFQISINKSPIQFYNLNNAHESWTEFLVNLGISGEAINVEITEGLLLDASDQVKDTLYQFRDSGIQVSLDDFGTGYSSLAYLQKFDIDFLKIDKSFISNISSGSDELALCEGIIEMAHKLNIAVIAEGVETEDQFRLLKAVSCDFMQGYYLSSALLPAQFEQFINNQTGVTVSKSYRLI